MAEDWATRTLRVHLLGYNSPPQTTPARERPYLLPGLIETAPIYRVTLATADHFKRVTTLNKSTFIKRHGNRIEAIVEDIHECILIRY